MPGRFSYMVHDRLSADRQAKARSAAYDLEKVIEEIPPGRAQSLALTRLEESYMWIGKAIRDAQIDAEGVS